MATLGFINGGNLTSLGIGTTNPTQLLELYSSAAAGSHSTLFTGNRIPKIGGGNGKNFLQIQCQDVNTPGLGSNITFFTDASNFGPTIEYCSMFHTFLNSSGTAPNVGIGTASPLAPLAVYATTGQNTNIGYFADSVYGSFNFSLNTGVGGYNPFTQTGDALLWVSKGTINTGCITIAPHNSGTLGIRIASTANTFSAGANTHSFVSNSSGTAMMTILGNGGVGIGTTNPLCKLDIAGGPIKTYTGSDVARIIMGPSPSGTNLDYCSLIESISSTASNYASILKFYTHGNGTTASDPTLAMTINFAQQVGIGTASPNAALSIYNNSTSAVFSLNIDSGTATSGSDCVYVYKKYTGNFVLRLDTVATYPASYIYFAGPSINPGTITATNATTMVYGTGSDYRIKSNVVPLSNSIDFINKLNPIYFTFNLEPTEVVAGFLAHEIQEVIPSAVSGEKDAVDASGNMVIQHLDNSFIIPYLTAAVQELSAKNAALEQSLGSLEARLAALEGAGA